LTFTITGAPEWVLLDSVTGTVSGTPDDDDAGTWHMILSAHNGMVGSSLPFSITVLQPPDHGHATLSWIAPTSNTNGHVLSNLVGYTIYFGNEAVPEGRVAVNDASALGQFLENLPFGLWLFHVTARNSDGYESAPSATVSKDIVDGSLVIGGPYEFKEAQVGFGRRDVQINAAQRVGVGRIASQSVDKSQILPKSRRRVR
jgi:hypothetical protein